MAELDVGVFLRQLGVQLADTDGLMKKASVNLAEESIDLIKQGFVDERDPYGDPWAPKKARDGRKVLSGPTSRLKGGWHTVGSMKAGFEIAPSVDYAIYHQDPQPRKRASDRETLRRRAREVDTARRDPFAGSDFVGPMRLTQKKRAMVPDERGLPDRWSEAFEETALEVFSAHFEIG